jgi:predicted regulator of Ras-like GTPase activity (Roadblock/LC7/MglB family)
VESLSKAVESDAHNYAALKLLGRLLTELGRGDQAAAAFAKILSFAPDDEEVKKLRGQLAPGPAAATLPPKPEPPAPRAAPAATADARPAAAAAQTEKGGLSGALAEVVGRDGIQGAALADERGLNVASALPSGPEEELTAAMAADLRRAASSACGELGLGGLEEMVVESGAGGLHLYAVREMTLAVFTAPRAKAGIVGFHARGLISRSLGRPEGAP